MAANMRSRTVLSRRDGLEERGGIGGDHRNRRYRAALPELRARPGANYARHSIGRCGRGVRRRLGARRPPIADAGRGRNHREFSQHQERGICRRAAGVGFYREGATGKPATRSGYLLPHQFPGSVLGGVRRGANRALSYTIERTPPGLVPVVRRHDGPRLGHRHGTRRHAHLCPMLRNRQISSSTAATISTPTARSSQNSHCPTAACGTASLPKRNRSRLKRSPNIAATTNTICSTTTCAPLTRRCPHSHFGTITK